MSTNFYFQNFPLQQITSEQLLVEDLVIEAMQIHGMDVYYLPRSSRDQVDTIYGEDTLKAYTKAYSIEMYLENVTGMDGEQDFISKFGLEIRDEITFLVSRRRFKYVTQNEYIRPREGDLVYIPLMRNFYEITFVEHENDQAMFYTLGRGRGGNVYVYALKLKQFVFSEELIETGVDEIDEQIRSSYKVTTLDIQSASANGVFELDEIVYQGANVETATAIATVFDYTANDSMKVIRVTGTFGAGVIKGNTTGYEANVLTMDTSTQVGNNLFEDLADNINIQTESDGIIDFTEINPFGEA